MPAPSPLQAAAAPALTPERLVSAARELAESGGYEAVTMNAVAGLAGVSRITAYKYFSNRDHLLLAVIVQWSEEVLAALRRRRFRGASAGLRVARRLEFVVRELLQKPLLLSAVMAASAAAGAAHAEASQHLNAVIDRYIGDDLAQLPAQRAPLATRLLGHVFYSVLLWTSSGRLALEEGLRDIRAQAELVFDVAG